MFMIPDLLYRGDADSDNVRQLRSVYPGGLRGFLLTNLGNSGSGREIFSAPLVAAVNRHVDAGWPKTHFLSFSSSLDRAMAFAAGKDLRPLVPTDAEAWDCAVITLDTHTFTTRQEIERGLFHCTYPGRIVIRDLRLDVGNIARIFSNAPYQGRPIPVLLIDVAAYIRHQISAGQAGLNNALAKASRDAEWLILPLDLSEGVPGELTAMLDDGCITRFQRYRR